LWELLNQLTYRVLSLEKRVDHLLRRIEVVEGKIRAIEQGLRELAVPAEKEPR
jgi:chaperonin cofactor prefoldin